MLQVFPQTRAYLFPLTFPLLCLLILAASVSAQDLAVSVNFVTKGALSPAESVELRLNRDLAPCEGQLAVLIGETDVTSICSIRGREISYQPGALGLTAANSTVTVYLVSSTNEWKEIARLPLIVEAKSEPSSEPNPPAPATDAEGSGFLGFQKSEFKPSLTLGLKSQSALLYFPDNNRPERINFTDITMQASLQAGFAGKHFKLQNQFDVVGVSYQREALRFGQQGEAAPQIDLSSYQVQMQVNRLKFNVGHTTYGDNRYLINSFSSRGVTVSAPITSQFDLSFNAANGTSIVGWDNFLGLNQRKHQVISGTLGYEALPKRPGGLRVEVGLLRGSLLPLNNFNQGNLTDTERSNGFGMRVVASDKDGRLRVDGGFGRSRFGNPTDPLLNQGLPVVPVEEAARNARYLELTYQLLRDISLTAERKVNLSVTFRHNRVDPLFRSIAVFTQADRIDNQYELSGSIGDITLNFGHNRLNDNLDDIPSILKTLNRRSGFNLALPVVSIIKTNGSLSQFWPRLSYAYERTHAFGAFLPINGDFADSHVPDQASTNQNLNADWQIKVLRLGYRLNHSFQDNRQVGREQADLKNLVNAFTVGLQPHRRFELNFDLSKERSNNLESGRQDNNLRAGVNFNWQATSRSAFAATISSTFAGDALQTNKSRSADLDLQWSMRFGAEKSAYRKVEGQFFIRYANRYARSEDNIFFFNNLTKLQTFNAGLTFTFF
ncbi:MAG TPA: hypothetical protein VMM84_17510 [Pyrinomonadaceae bacterium]|nr:hypothetical protein [Pyrinomonadaceae bacterium]